MPLSSLRPLLLVLLWGLSPASHADLDSYERAARQDREEKNNTSTCRQTDKNRDEDCFADDLMVEVLFLPFRLLGEAMQVMAEGSLQREQGVAQGDEHPLPPRQPHDRDIPRLALDLNLQRVDADTFATGIRLETGWGPVGVEADTLRYRQHDPAASLDISHAHLMARGSAQVVQLNLGLGAVLMQGKENNSGPSLLATLSIFPTAAWAVDLRNTNSWINGNHLADYDAALAWGRQGYALRAGYHYSTVRDESLHGPYIGLSWRY